MISAISSAYRASSSLGEASKKRSKRERNARCSAILKVFPFQLKLPFSKSIESLDGSKTRLAISRKVLLSSIPFVGALAPACADWGDGCDPPGPEGPPPFTGKPP